MRQATKVSVCWDSAAFVTFFVALATFCEQCVILWRAALASALSICGRTMRTMSNHMPFVRLYPTMRVVLTDSDRATYPASTYVALPVSDNVNRDGYSLDAIPAYVPTPVALPVVASVVALDASDAVDTVVLPLDTASPVKAARKPRAVKASPVQPVKVKAERKPRKASKVAAQEAATVTTNVAGFAPAVNLDGLTYRALQTLAKAAGIKANQSAAALREQLAAKG
jgi:hypothetical protein